MSPMGCMTQTRIRALYPYRWHKEDSNRQRNRSEAYKRKRQDSRKEKKRAAKQLKSTEGPPLDSTVQDWEKGVLDTLEFGVKSEVKPSASACQPEGEASHSIPAKSDQELRPLKEGE